LTAIIFVQISTKEALVLGNKVSDFELRLEVQNKEKFREENLETKKRLVVIYEDTIFK